MRISIHQPNFVPWYPFFQKIQQCDKFIILTHCQFEKNGYQVNTLEMDYLIDPFWKPKLYNKVKMSDIIFHVGAISDTKLQDSGIMLFYNYEFSRVLIDYAYELNKKIVYSSSAANAGSGDGIPNNIYGWSKLLTENYGIAKGGVFVALRYFNVYGPGEEEKGDMASIAYQAYENKKIKLFPLKPTNTPPLAIP